MVYACKLRRMKVISNLFMIFYDFLLHQTHTHTHARMHTHIHTHTHTRMHTHTHTHTTHLWSSRYFASCCITCISMKYVLNQKWNILSLLPNLVWKNSILMSPHSGTGVGRVNSAYVSVRLVFSYTRSWSCTAE